MTRLRRLWNRTLPRRARRWLRTHVPRRIWGILSVAAALLGVGTVGLDPFK